MEDFCGKYATEASGRGTNKAVAAWLACSCPSHSVIGGENIGIASMIKTQSTPAVVSEKNIQI